MSLLRYELNQTFTTQWQALRLFNLYRLILSLGFLAIILFEADISFKGAFDEWLYFRATCFYFVFSLFFLCTSLLTKKQYALQVNSSIFIDIFSLILIMHASGGLITGIGILLIVVVAAHSLLMPGKISFLGAATAAIGLLVEYSYTVLAQDNPISIYTQVGFLGLVIFATSSVTNILSLRARKSQLIVEEQAIQLATSQQLNAYIVSAMHAGVLVLDNDNKIRLINLAAKKLLGLDNDPLSTLDSLPSKFIENVKSWQEQRKVFAPQQMSNNSPEVRLSFLSLGKPLPVGTLIFIYNASEEARQAQDLKLASLGHLTANIAHELRNPLGAASHAAQLVAESSSLSQEDTQLVKMIKESCDRMNTVIQNVLSLSGRKPAKTEQIMLIPWLEDFIQKLVIPQIPFPKILFTYDRDDIMIQADPSQLTQILIILCENGLRYSLKKVNEAAIEIRVKLVASTDAVYIDIIDQGEGIPSSLAKHIFEPFFTTENTGSGLGLYIAKELSEMNGVRLTHNSVQNGYQFRITIPYQENLAWHSQQPW